LDPWSLSDEEFVDRWTEAAWLDQHRTRELAKVLGLTDKKQ
jgi:hypothetical protein